MASRKPKVGALAFACDRLKLNYPTSHPFLGDDAYPYVEVEHIQTHLSAYFFHQGASVTDKTKHVDAMLVILLGDTL